VRHEVLAGADHGLTHERWRRAWGDILVRWLSGQRAGAAC
jgi:hypothetical protein